MENIKFSNLRYELLKEVQNVNTPSDITDGFRKKFMALIELCTFSLMNEEENFFALFMIQMRREIKLDMPSATGITASLSCFNMYFNPEIFLNCTLEEMKALIKHEIYHVMHGHLKRANILKRKYSTLAVNLAMDVSINQYIDNLPVFMDTLQSVSLSYKADLKIDGTLEEYCEKIQQALNALKIRETHEKIGKIEDKHDSEHVHDIWDLCEDSLNFEQVDELIKKTSLNSIRGKIPLSIGKYIKAMDEKPEISWQEYLKRISGSFPAGYKKIITRKDRRQPERLDLRGRLPDHTAQIAVAIDISGSMTDIEIEQAMVEIFSIAGSSRTGITIIECDSEVRRAYKVRNKNDIRKKLDTKGGTRFAPVFKYMKKNNMRDYLLIYFTDGKGEEELPMVPVNYKTLWVLTGKGEKLSLKNGYGEVKRLSNVKVQESDLNYAKNEMKEFLVEWQK